MHRALIVGISDYGRLNQPLPGCINDMNGWRDYLASALNIGPAEIRLLSDSRATRSAILARINWLLSDAEGGDQRFFVFAGHGARLRRRDLTTGKLGNKLDETLVAYPGDRDDYEDFMIFDEDLAALVDGSGFPSGARLTFIFDSCHSGGLLRELIALGENPPLPRCLRLPSDVLSRSFEARPLAVRSIGSLENANLRVPRLIVAAATADQSAWDDQMPDSKRHGVFSYYALEALKRNPQLVASQIIAAAEPQIAVKFPQRPVLLGTETRFEQALAS